ncbi:UNVERIFIED_CONTAM: DNA-binding transcriptional MerR regulator [Brevibacillus sp. OAP136]
MVCTYMTQKIGDVAKQLNLTVPTIRYYEEIGQLQIARKNKVREFTPQDIQLLHAIREWKELGFSLNELREIAALEKNGLGCKDMQLNRVKEVLSRKKLEDLKRLREQTNRQIA